MTEIINSSSVISWLITYGIHSTVILGLALIFCRFGKHSNFRNTDQIIKIALVGAILTASVQSILPASPYSLNLTALQDQIDIDSEENAKTGYMNSTRSATIPLNSDIIHELLESQKSEIDKTVKPLSWTDYLLIIWISGVALLAIRYVIQWKSYLAIISDRVQIHDRRIDRAVAVSREKYGFKRDYKITTSKSLVSPVALGFNEICLPENLITNLNEDEILCTIGHEIAHLNRYDPIWKIVFGIVKVLFFFQPLNRIAIKQYLLESEYICDEAAAGINGNPLAVVKSLYKCVSNYRPQTRGKIVCSLAGDGALFERSEKMLN